MQLAGRNNKAAAHPAIAMNAKGQVVFAAVGMAAPAGVAALAVNVRLHRAAVPRLHIAHPFAHRQDLHAKLVSWDSWIREKRHLAQKPGVVSPADPDSM